MSKFKPYRSVLLLQFVLLAYFSFGQTSLGDYKAIDPNLLNEYILKEVNGHRKKAKVDPLINRSELFAAAEDQASYMRQNEKITHYQKRNKLKKTPKNRVDFYSGQFHKVGENCQLNNLNLGGKKGDKKNPPITTYEQLAEKLVTGWRNSPPHYANMIEPEFETTFTAVSITETGEVYACQVFGGSKYEEKYKEFRDTVRYKPEVERKCWTCNFRQPDGAIKVLPDSSIVFEYQTAKLRFPSIRNSRMRFFNLWNDGLAADIVLKSQYTCDSSSYFNGRRGVRGIPLPPVYKKDFDHIGLFSTHIYLGKVPSYIHEDFEVNLTVIKHKRTCTNTYYDVIPAEYYVEIPLNYGLASKDASRVNYLLETLSNKLYFDKSMITPKDSALNAVLNMVTTNRTRIHHIELLGYASIEGTTEKNIELYKERADYLLKYLIVNGIDSVKIKVNAEENYKDFRKDILGTDYAKLGELSDQELKIKLLNKQLSTELEFLLKNHRYVEIRVVTKDTNNYQLNKEATQQQLQEYIDQKNLKKCFEMQQVEYGLALEGKISLHDLDNVKIPNEKKFLKLLHDRAIMKYELDSLNTSRLSDLEAGLKIILPLDTTNERINTSLEIIEYYNYEAGLSALSPKEYFKELKEKKYIDPRQKARMLLNFASGTDIQTFRATGSRNPKRYYYDRVKSYIQTADLDVDKSFEIASYYSFFRNYGFAYSLINSKIDETKSADDLVFFLKLIHLTGLQLPRDTYLKYFKRISEYSGSEFCSYFNNPALNFQILDDEEIKAIYCKECAKVLNSGIEK